MAQQNSSVIDLRPTIVPKSDQLNADDLIGCTKTITITAVKLLGEPDQPFAIHYEGDAGKPYKPCKSMRRVMVNVWGPDGGKFIGRSMTLYRDETVRFGGMDVGGIRISHMSDIDRPVTMALTATRANRRPYTVQPLRGDPRSNQPQIDLPNILAAGRTAAVLGSGELTKWWTALTNAEKLAAKPTLDGELKVTATRADQAALGDDSAGSGGFPGDKPRPTLAERVQAFKDELKGAPDSASMRRIRQDAQQLFDDVDAGDPEAIGTTTRGLDRWVDDQIEGREDAERSARGER